MKSKIQSQLKKFLAKKYPSYKGEVVLEYPPEPKMGDLSLPCFELAKVAKKSPNQIATELATEHALEQIKIIDKIEVIGPYLNFFLNKEYFWRNLLSFPTTPAAPTTPTFRIMLEFSSPNTNKPLHLGHLRNNCLGDSLANLLESQNHKVIRASLINDRGVHICKSMLAYQKVKNGEWKLSNDSNISRVSSGSNIKGDHIVGDYYILYSQKEKENPRLKDEIQTMLKKWEQGDKKIITLAQKLNKIVITGLNQTYKRMDVKFDKVYYESQEYEPGRNLILEMLKKRKCYKRKDGAVEINLKKFGLDKKVLLRADGTSVYITQDLGLAVNRQKSLKLDKIIYIVANEQDYYFKVLFKILELFGFKWAKNLYHLSYALVNLTTGKMKSREGTVVDADDLMDEMHELARVEIKKREPKLNQRELNKRAEIIGLGAMKFYLLKHSPGQTITYNPRESISFEGATGPYIQYTYARIKSILRKSKIKNPKVKINPKSKMKGQMSDVRCQMLNTDEEWELGKSLNRYQDVIAESAEEYNPSRLAIYLLDLAQSFNTFYHKHKVIAAKTKELKNTRLILIAKVAEVLSCGLKLLSIKTLERM